MHLLHNARIYSLLFMKLLQANTPVFANKKNTYLNNNQPRQLDLLDQKDEKTT